MKFLLFQTRHLSYDSSWWFMEMLRRSFLQCGVRVRCVQLSEDILAQEDMLRALTKERFDGIFDINSRLANVMLDDRYYPDWFDAPFYHMIVDHPMHVHYSLSIPLRQYYILCLDRYHKKYIETWYPHIRAVYVFPFAGICAAQAACMMADETDGWQAETVTDRQTLSSCFGIPLSKRSFDLLFPGTYTPLSYYRQQMENISDDQAEIAMRILTKLRGGCSLPVDQLYRQEIAPDDAFFALRMHKARLIDRYLREWYRESVIHALLQAGLRVDVMGFRWEMFPAKPGEQLVIHPPQSYEKQLQALGDSRMVCNVQPLFLDGVHDRVMNAMCNGSVAVTDGCDFLRRNFQAGMHYLEYDKNAPKQGAEEVLALLANASRMQEMADRAGEAVEREHTWLCRTESFLREISTGNDA